MCSGRLSSADKLCKQSQVGPKSGPTERRPRPESKPLYTLIVLMENLKKNDLEKKIRRRQQI